MPGPMRKPIFWAVFIAALGGALRWSMIDFPIHAHPDEPIIGSLMHRAITKGSASANWDGFTHEWSRPTLQFSPYTLVQCAVARTADAVVPIRTLHDLIWFARLTSCVWGSLAVFTCYLVGRQLFDWRVGLASSLLLATTLLHVQDSIYARVEAFWSLVILGSLYCCARTLGAKSAIWLFAAALTAGVAVAAKYNAVTLAVPLAVSLAVLIVNRSQEGSRRPRRAGFLLVLLVLIGAALGFLAATPELITRPAIFWNGVQYEFDHYRTGHVPHQAFDAWDNNVFYWFRYFTQLGFGWVGFVLLCGFLAFAFFRRTPQDLLLALFVASSIVLLGSTTVRFERNWELALGAGCIAASACLFAVVDVRGSKVTQWAKWSMVVLAVGGYGIQSAVLLWRFQQKLALDADFARHLPARASVLEYSAVPPGSGPPPNKVLAIVGYGDPFSRELQRRWTPVYPPRQRQVFTSYWAQFQYPFSTIDTYHGPRRLILLVPSNGR